MGLPFSRQRLGDFIKDREFTHRQVARALDCKAPRINSLIMGRVYPTSAEIEALERLVELPIQTMFDSEVLKYFNPEGSRFSRARREGSETDQ